MCSIRVNRVAFLAERVGSRAEWRALSYRGSGVAAGPERGDEHVVYRRRWAGIARPRDLAPAPLPEGVLRRGGLWKGGKARSFLGQVRQYEVVQGLPDALPPP